MTAPAPAPYERPVPLAAGGPPVVVENEFARVVISVDQSGNSPRLRIEALDTGNVGYLDALSLERLAGLSQDDLAGLFAVGQYRSHDRREEGRNG